MTPVSGARATLANNRAETHAAHRVNMRPETVCRTVMILVLLASTQARADGAWGVKLGATPSLHRIGSNSDFMLSASSQLDAAYRIVDGATVAAGIGAHLGIAY